MARWLLLIVVVGHSCGSSADAQTREEKVRNDKQKVEAEGYWIYNDWPQALAQAKATGKPIVAVLRCLPCEECVKLDDDLIDADQRVKPLLDEFVRVRIVSTNGLDLSLFQFDTDQSFAVFLLNADQTIYGRFGTRSHRTNWIGDVSIDGMAKALAGALALHREYPKNKAALAAKRGPVPEVASPENFPSLKAKYKATLDYEGKVVQSCIHCHQIGDAVRELTFARQGKLPDTLLFPYPHPKTLGLVLDPKEMATVLEVVPNTDAAKAGFKAGDQIRTLDGQPLISIADVQWVLHHASPEGVKLSAGVMRNGRPVQLTLDLAQGWRERDDLAWRVSSWGLRRVTLGGMHLVPLAEEERVKRKLAPQSTALLIDHVGQFGDHAIAHRAGVKKGDILIGFDSRTDLLRETDLIAYGTREKKPGDPIPLTILRNGEKKTLVISRPK